MRSEIAIAHKVQNLRGYNMPRSRRASDTPRPRVAPGSVSKGRGGVKYWTAAETQVLLDLKPAWNITGKGNIVLVANNIKADPATSLMFSDRTADAIAQRIYRIRAGTAPIPHPREGHTRTNAPEKVGDHIPIEKDTKIDQRVNLIKTDDRALFGDIRLLDHQHKTGVSTEVWQRGIERTTKHLQAFYNALKTMADERDAALVEGQNGVALKELYTKKIAPLYKDFEQFAKGDPVIQKRIEELKEIERQEKAMKQQAEEAAWNERDEVAKREREVYNQRQQQPY
jgi:ketosteroid isomerase-like protein